MNFLEIAKNIILSKIDLDNYHVFMFGSRATNNYQRHSDLDIGVLGKEPFNIIQKMNLEESYNESIVPYPLDLIDFLEVSDAFRKTALKDIKIWNKAKNLSNITLI